MPASSVPYQNLGWWRFVFRNVDIWLLKRINGLSSFKNRLLKTRIRFNLSVIVRRPLSSSLEKCVQKKRHQFLSNFSSVGFPFG